MANVTRLCHTKSIATVNGKFPGPPIVAREGDRLVIKVVNHIQSNITLHWYVHVLFTHAYIYTCLKVLSL